ncbi:MaoC/PaaZ C-terminal domain-containing protein [Neobacillus niacini]|uniref:MaoC/PaaZ C-terminal domain-containing protein n=1 Tax=Neobacillus niacini TaxID=86668 RepID=UPI00203B5000|nr:MaoC/PaaZ C-terminal domain-containing protein [Neobacillus niacini]MCM3691223.1 dehydratase [Neobacillus niacini]
MKTLSELQIAASLDPIQLEPVSRLDLIKYAGASGDYNPIHTIDEAASEAGLSGIIAHGMWTMGNLSKLFSPFLEEGFVQDYTIRFARMVYLNDVITLKANLVEKAGEVFTFKVAAENQDGKVVISGVIKFKLY